MVYLVNLSEKDYLRKKNKWLPKIFEWVQAHGGDPIIPFRWALGCWTPQLWSSQGPGWMNCTPTPAAGVHPTHIPPHAKSRTRRQYAHKNTHRSVQT